MRAAVPRTLLSTAVPGRAAVLAALVSGCARGPGPAGEPGVQRDSALPAAARALAHLEREVPRWPRDNACYSCHHSGDAARALFAASALGHRPAQAAWNDTLQWLLRPRAWDEQEGDPSFSDKTLARLQFTAALAEAAAAGLVPDREVLAEAGDAVAALQEAAGGWTVEPHSRVGSPATWGSALATALMARTLQTLDAGRHAGAIRRAAAWLGAIEVVNVYQAAAVILGLAGLPEELSPSRRDPCDAILRRGVSECGGWGPYPNAPPEVFDTALVVLALAASPGGDESRRWLRRGRGYLVSTQLDDGSWPATTRPTGGVSHAQSTSTSAWAALALWRSAALD